MSLVLGITVTVKSNITDEQFAEFIKVPDLGEEKDGKIYYPIKIELDKDNNRKFFGYTDFKNAIPLFPIDSIEDRIGKIDWELVVWNTSDTSEEIYLYYGDNIISRELIP